ncbi:DUF1643 domain-containing protein [Vibrio sp.]|uniref:DUF1643 domain-containing protein n=1 Tax=Vibrio sp. TaxID=678 RepID=UPI00311EABEE
MSYVITGCERDEIYRYALFVETSCNSEDELVVIQCNPSVANEEKSDPTVGKVSIWAEENGFGKVVFLNLFAYISPCPKDLIGKSYDYLVGSKNNQILEQHINDWSTIVLAWGGDVPVENKIYYQRLSEVKEIMDKTGAQPYKVGALSHGTHPRHGRTWNKGNRELSTLYWESIIA